MTTPESGLAADHRIAPGGRSAGVDSPTPAAHPGSGEALLAAPRPIHGLTLVVDDEPARRAVLARTMVLAGAPAVLAVAPDECATLDQLAPSVVVAVVGAKRALERATSRLIELNPHTLAILVTSLPHEQVCGQVQLPKERLHVVGVPPSTDELGRLIARKCPRRGGPGPFTPAEYVQQAGLGGHSVTLHCIDTTHEELGVILMLEGRVHLARHAGTSGFAAFAALVTRVDTRVLLGDPFEGDMDADLALHWQVLILEAMRRFDERERSSSAAPIPRSNRGSDLAALLSDAPPARRSGLSRAATIPEMPVSEMRETLGSTRGSPRADVRALVESGVRAVIDQDYPRAIQCFEAAQSADPKNASVRHRLDRLYAMVGAKS